MVSVTEALKVLTDLIEPGTKEIVPLQMAAGRVLAGPVEAQRDQPPFAASAMDVMQCKLLPFNVARVTG